MTVKESATAEVPADNVLGQLLTNLGFSSFSGFDISNTEEFKNQGVKKNQIEYSNLKKFQLEVIDPPEGDLSFLDSVYFFVKSEGIPTKLIASGGEFGTDKRVNLLLEKVDLKPYLIAPSMSITSKAKGRLPSKKTTLKASIEIFVEVDVGGSISGS